MYKIFRYSTFVLYNNIIHISVTRIHLFAFHRFLDIHLTKCTPIFTDILFRITCTLIYSIALCSHTLWPPAPLEKEEMLGVHFIAVNLKMAFLLRQLRWKEVSKLQSYLFKLNHKCLSSGMALIYLTIKHVLSNLLNNRNVHIWDTCAMDSRLSTTLNLCCLINICKGC